MVRAGAGCRPRAPGAGASSTGGAGSVVVVADTVSEHSARERNRAREEE